MMRLTTEQVKEFQTLYFMRFSVELTKDEAIDKGLSLLSAVSSAYKGADR